MYKFEAIVLSIDTIQEKNTRIVLFSEEFGRITAWYKKKKLSGIDIGDIGQVIINRKEGKNYIKSIQGKIFLIQRKWDYNTLYNFLGTLNILMRNTTESDAHISIFHDYKKMLGECQQGISLEASKLLQMRFLRYLGILSPQFFQNDKILNYIYNHIHTTPIERLARSKPFTPQQHHKIDTGSLHAVENFL